MAVRMRNTIANGGMTGKDATINKVFSHREGNTYSTAKRFTKAGNPNSSQQALVRNTFAQTSAGWSALSEAERQLWNNEAPNWVNTGIFGNKKQSGKNLFTGCNVVLVLAGKDIIPVPLSKQLIMEIGFAQASLSAGVLKFVCEFDVNSVENVVQLAVSSQQTAGTSICKKFTILRNYTADDDVDDNITSYYVAKYGALVAGNKMFYEVRMISQGGNTIKLKTGVVTL